MLIKLDSGDYINTDFVRGIFADSHWDGHERIFSGEFSVDYGEPDGGELIISAADKDRIVEYMAKSSTIEDLVEAVKHLHADLGYLAG